ncbi:MAG: DUF2807 domain-containing protein, partial [Chthoniobacterales bacterium]
MKTKLFAVCLLFALSGCDVGGIRGNGHMVTQEQKLEPFINVKADGAFQIDWHIGPPAVSVTIDQNLMQYVEMEVRDRVLYARTARNIRPKHSIKVVLTSNTLEGASFSGASQLTAHQLTGSKFYLETTGASKATLDGA